MPASALIREIILENFMSYEYSRVPFKPGLNLVCGPNGAGKSSILLGLAVALGQTYTERSRRLSDLIRRGKDLGRVSVVFDNSPNNGKRPISSINSDTIVLSRYLNRDGAYWYEANNRMIMKGEVLRLLERLSINPDNMLIIMHQNMIDVFGAIDAHERLKLVEEAVGLREYREHILEAREKLSHTLSEEESIRNLLEKAQETLRYWEGEYGRFQRKRELGERKRELELEYAWAKCIRQEEAVENLQLRLEELNGELRELRQELEENSKREEKLETKLKKLEFELDGAYQKLIAHERAHAEAEARAKLIESFTNSLRSVAGAGLNELLGHLGAELERAKKNLREASGRANDVKSELVEARGELERTRESHVNSRVHIAVLGFRRELLERDISGAQSELRRARRELEQLVEEAKQVGERVETQRKPQEVLDDLKLTNIQLASLVDVSPDVERMYLSYKSTLKELEAKAEVAAANRQRALEELELRKKRWANEVGKLLREVKKRYGEILTQVNASGDVNLTNAHDIDEAGLELLVGFKGSEPQVLDAYTQSGGERTTALMCFLLALQQHIKSPIRAIDEFEAHLDPRNREAILRGIIEFMKGEGTQYIVITPGRLMDVEGVPNVITVQNVAGSSRVKVTA
ncbi:MAG: AAA family ATPase [Candidatus Hodarchaeaceae archaeon]|nr:AAA family ATPase [Candidatus Hodarchaeaceae archaeon]